LIVKYMLKNRLVYLFFLFKIKLILRPKGGEKNENNST